MSDGMGAVAPAVSSGSQSTQQTSASTNEAPKIETPSFKGVKHRIKVDGQEQDVDHDQVLRDYQTKVASDKRFQEAATKEKEAKQILSALESGDFKFVESKLGKQKTKELLENYLIDDLEYQQLSPAEKRALELENENKTLKQKQEDEKKSQEEKEYQATLERAHRDLDTEVHQALQSLGKKPTPRMAMRVVDEMLIRQKQKISAKDASGYALKGIHDDIKEYLPGLSVEELRQVLPQDVIDRLREDEVQKVTGQLSQRRAKPQQTKARTQEKPRTLDDWYETRPKQLKGRK